MQHWKFEKYLVPLHIPASDKWSWLDHCDHHHLNDSPHQKKTTQTKTKLAVYKIKSPRQRDFSKTFLIWFCHLRWPLVWTLHYTKLFIHFELILKAHMNSLRRSGRKKTETCLWRSMKFVEIRVKSSRCIKNLLKLGIILAMYASYTFSFYLFISASSFCFAYLCFPHRDIEICFYKKNAPSLS